MILNSFYGFNIDTAKTRPRITIKGNYRPFAFLQQDVIFMLNGLPLQVLQVDLKESPYKSGGFGQKTERTNLDIECSVFTEVVPYNNDIVKTFFEGGNRFVTTFAVNGAEYGFAVTGNTRQEETAFFKCLSDSSVRSQIYERCITVGGGWYVDEEGSNEAPYRFQIYGTPGDFSSGFKGSQDMQGLKTDDIICVNDIVYMVRACYSAFGNDITNMLECEEADERMYANYNRIFFLPPERINAGNSNKLKVKLLQAWDMLIEPKNGMNFLSLAATVWNNYEPVILLNEPAKAEPKAIPKIKQEVQRIPFPERDEVETTMRTVLMEDGTQALEVKGMIDNLKSINAGTFVYVRDKIFIADAPSSDGYVITVRISLYSGTLPRGTVIQRIEIEPDDLKEFGYPPIVSEAEETGVSYTGFIPMEGIPEPERAEIIRNPLRKVRRRVELDDD